MTLGQWLNDEKQFFLFEFSYMVEEVFLWKILICGGISVKKVISFLLEIEKIWNSTQIILIQPWTFGNNICFLATTPSKKSNIEIKTDMAKNSGVPVANSVYVNVLLLSN